MEPQQRDEAHESDRQQADRSASPAKRDDFNPPFASNGLEQVRDSHC